MCEMSYLEIAYCILHPAWKVLALLFIAGFLFEVKKNGL